MQARDVESEMFEHSGLESMKDQAFRLSEFPEMIRFGSSMNQNGILKTTRRLFDRTPGDYGAQGYQSHGRRASAMPQQMPREMQPAFDLDWYPMDVYQ